jgi:hypothetical protein
LAVSDLPMVVKPNVELASGGSLTSSALVASVEPNRAFVISVICMVSLTLWLAMWLAISGAGKQGVLELAFAVKNDRR